MDSHSSRNLPSKLSQVPFCHGLSGVLSEVAMPASTFKPFPPNVELLHHAKGAQGLPGLCQRLLGAVAQRAGRRHRDLPRFGFIPRRNEVRTFHGGSTYHIMDPYGVP